MDSATIASLLIQHSRPRGRPAANQNAVKPPCDSTEESSSDSSEEEWSGQRSLVQATCVWNGSEVTYFRMLHPIFVNNFCAISQLLCSKTCVEVFEYAQRVAMEIRKPKSKRLAAKKKKKSMRCVMCVCVMCEVCECVYRSWTAHHRKIQSKLEGLSTSQCNYTPCEHPGISCDTNCSCVSTRNFCEKFCGCAPDCPNRCPPLRPG